MKYFPLQTCFFPMHLCERVFFEQQETRLSMTMELEEVTTCTHQSLTPIWGREPLSMRGLFILIFYPLILKLPRF